MDGFLVAIPAVLLILACPLMMVVPGVGAWLWARARGQKRALSVGCMAGRGDERPATTPEEYSGQLEHEVAGLRREVQALRTQLQADAPAGVTPAELTPVALE